MRLFTPTHEWVEWSEQAGTLGITSVARRELGEISFVGFPPIGTRLARGQECCVLESLKAAIDLFAPVDMEIVQVNQALLTSPELLNQSPETDGWLLKFITPSPVPLADFLDPDQYARLVRL